MTKLVKWLEKPVKVGGVQYPKDSVLIMLGIVLIGCAALGFDYLNIFFLNLLFYLSILFSILGHLIYWGLEVKNKSKQCSTNGY